MFGGNAPGLSNQSLTYNGSAWTSTPTLNTARGGIAGANRGTENSTLAFQGNTDNGPTYASNLVTLIELKNMTELVGQLKQIDQQLFEIIVYLDHKMMLLVVWEYQELIQLHKNGVELLGQLEV
jgi:hypothetical protein